MGGTQFEETYSDIVVSIELGIKAITNLGVTIQGLPFSSQNLIFDDAWKPRAYIKSVLLAFLSNYDYIYGAGDSTQNTNNAALIGQIMSLIVDKKIKDSSEVDSILEDTILNKGSAKGNTSTIEDEAVYALVAFLIPMINYIEFADTYKGQQVQQAQSGQASATAAGTDARTWVLWLDKNNLAGNIYYNSKEGLYYTIKSKNNIVIWDDARDEEVGNYTFGQDDAKFLEICSQKIFIPGKPGLQPNVTLAGTVKKSSLKNIQIRKIAGFPPYGTPLPKPGTTATSGSGSGTGAIYATNDWPAYVAKGGDRATIEANWKKIISNAGGTYKEGDNSYTDQYTSYRQWWIDHGSNLNVAGVISEFDKILQGQAASGATGTQADPARDALLIQYLTKPFPPSKLTGRNTLFGQIKARIDDSVKTVNNKEYLDKTVARSLVDGAWKKNIEAAYKADDVDGLLSTMIASAPDVDESAAGVATSGAATPQAQQPRQTGGVANLSTIKGAQYYQIPAGKFNLFVRKGRPYDTDGIMMQDTRAGRISQPVDISSSPRFREYLGSREIRRILEMVAVNEGQGMVPAYKAVLEGQKITRPGWQTLIRSKKRESEMAAGAASAIQGFEDARRPTTASRQSRLDNLKKKGVI